MNPRKAYADIFEVGYYGVADTATSEMEVEVEEAAVAKDEEAKRSCAHLKSVWHDLIRGLEWEHSVSRMSNISLLCPHLRACPRPVLMHVPKDLGIRKDRSRHREEP